MNSHSVAAASSAIASIFDCGCKRASNKTAEKPNPQALRVSLLLNEEGNGLIVSASLFTDFEEDESIEDLIKCGIGSVVVWEVLVQCNNGCFEGMYVTMEKGMEFISTKQRIFRTDKKDNGHRWRREVNLFPPINISPQISSYYLIMFWGLINIELEPV